MASPAITAAIPSGGRRISIPLNPASTSGTIASAVQTGLDADAQFVATISGSGVAITDAAYGARTEIASGNSFFTVARTTTGAFGDLHGKSFLIYDDTNQSVAVYLTETGATPPAGNLALDASRYISVTILFDDDASEVGGKILTPVHADADFTCTGTSTLTITNATNGDRGTAIDTDTGFAVAVTIAGMSLAVNIPVDATDTALETLLGSGFDVTKSGNFTWDITFGVNGVQNAFTAVTTGVALPLTVKGQISLATTTCLAAFDAQTEDNITAIEELQVTFPGKSPWTVYRNTITIFKDVIDFSTLAPPPTSTYVLSSLTARQDITSLALLAAVVTAGGVSPKVLLVSITGEARLWELVSGTDATTTGIQRPSDYNASTNAYVWKAIF